MQPGLRMTIPTIVGTLEGIILTLLHACLVDFKINSFPETGM